MILHNQAPTDPGDQLEAEERAENRAFESLLDSVAILKGFTGEQQECHKQVFASLWGEGWEDVWNAWMEERIPPEDIRQNCLHLVQPSN